MNKKVFRNGCLLALVFILGLTVIDFKRTTNSYEEEIGFFIQENLEEGKIYSPRTFEKVNESFLSNLTQVSNSFSDIRDSIKNQLDIIISNQSTYHSELNEAQLLFEKLTLSSLNKYLIADARLKRAIKSKSVKEKLRAESSKMQTGISDLNAALSVYNLSIFNLNFETAVTEIYLHHFELNDQNFGITKHQGIFELDKKTKQVVSYKEI